MSITQGEARRSGPIDRPRPIARPEMGTRRPVRSRSAEAQAFNSAKTQEANRKQLEPRVEPVDARAELRASDPWEALRQDYVAQGNIFDARGYITKKGQDELMSRGWDMPQIIHLEHLQRNHAGEVTVVSAGEGRDEGPAMSARERPKKFADAQVAAEELLQARGQAEAERRKQQAERSALGVRAEMNAIHAGKTNEDAARLRKQAEEAYDLQQQREQNLRAAS